MKSLLRTLTLLFAVSAVRADMFPPPFQSVAVSLDSEYIARVDRGWWNEAEKRRAKDWVSIHRYDRDKREFVRVSQFEYGAAPGSGFLVVANGGTHVVGACVGNGTLGLRLYNQAGKLLGTWPIKDFLTEDEIAGCAKTGSTLQWFQAGAFSYDGKSFHFSGPATHIASWGSSYTVMKGAKEGLRFRFTIDLKSLTLKREQ